MISDEMAQKIADRINFEARVKLDRWHKIVLVLLVIQLLLAGWHLYYHEHNTNKPSVEYGFQNTSGGAIVPQATRTEPK
jgi:hypothetical protein